MLLTESMHTATLHHYYACTSSGNTVAVRLYLFLLQRWATPMLTQPCTTEFRVAVGVHGVNAATVHYRYHHIIRSNHCTYSVLLNKVAVARGE